MMLYELMPYFTLNIPKQPTKSHLTRAKMGSHLVNNKSIKIIYI